MSAEPLIEQCRKLYGMSIIKFGEEFNISLSTLKLWRKNLPSYGETLLLALMENHELKRQLQVLDNLKAIVNKKDEKKMP